MTRHFAMAALLSLSAAAWGQTRPDIPVTSPPQDRIIPLEVTINGDRAGTWPFVERQGMLHASREALDEWRVRLRPGAEPITVRGVEYWPLAAVPGFAVKTNYSTQSADITFAAEAFTATKVTAQKSERAPISPVLPSAFFNYEFNYANSRPRAGVSTSDLGAIVEAGGSTQLGVLTSSYVGRNLTRGGLDRSGWARLETTFTRDLPQHQLTLRLGDSSTRPGMWGRTVYFAGAQIGTNYSLTPGFLTQPIPIVSGVSAAPSTVELYVNDVLRQVSQVPAGPFAIDNTAALTGSGEARVVVRDILGREVVITQPFFTSASLLAPGLADWGAEVGALRRDLGQANAHYGPAFGAGTWRYGFTDRFTAEARAEATRKMRTLGLGLVAGLPGDILARGAWAASHDEAVGNGRHWMIGAEKQWLTTAIYAQAEGSSRNFRSLGLGGASLPIRLQWAVNATHTTSSFGNFGFAVARFVPWNGPGITTASLNYSLRVGRNSTLSASLSKAFSQASNGISIGMTLNVPLERNRQMTATVNSHGGRTDAYATASQTAGLDTDFGWRVLGGWVNSEAHGEAGAYYEGRYGRLYSDVSSSPSQTSWRAGASGGVVFAAGTFFATRRVDQSYAVAEVKGQPDVGVGLGTNMLTKTNASGLALVPNLGAYTPNQIRLDPQDLAISVEIGSIEKIVVPSWRSAVKADFPVRGGRAALLKVQLDDGEPAPAGAVVRIEGDREEFLVARRGEAYVTGLEPASRVTLTWNGQSCRLDIRLPPAGKDEIPRIGPVPCHGVKR